ncbi:MAG: flagellar basal body protein FliL [Rhodocyclaceae bacterium]|nr:MAG: flagellar basal body protein FliL [Rhodocyclaceae bacterium]
MAEATEQEAPKKKKGKLLLFIIIGVLVVVLGGGAAAFLLLKKAPVEDGEDGETTHAKVDKKKAHDQAPPAYVKLDTFTSNLAPENPGDQQAAQYIQVVVELKVADPHEGDALKPYTPEVRNAILRLLSSRKPSQLAPTEGKDALATDIRNAVNSIINPPKKGEPAPEEPVQAVLFSSFIIQ